MPYTLDDEATSAQLLTLFPEISMKYGSDVILTLEIQIKAKSGDFLTLSKSNGIEIGKGATTKISLLIYCTN